MATFLLSYLQSVLNKLIQLPTSILTYLSSYLHKPIKPPLEQNVKITKCRYRLDTDTSFILLLPDGRKLGYAQYGSRSSEGHTVFYLHGLPGSRMEVASFDEIAIELGIRIISVDRPGIGWSSPHPNRSILSHAKDIEHLASHLKVKEYGILGISGGGPYALACARALPAENLRVVSIVCGLGPPDMGYNGMNWSNRLGFSFAQHYFPGICRWWVSREPAARLDLSDEERMLRLQQSIEKSKSSMNQTDIEIFGDADLMKLYLRSSQEAFGQGMNGFSQDARLACKDWGFRIEDIRKNLPFQLWYGKLDTNVPLRHGQQIAERLGDQAQLTIADTTHAGISYHWRSNILEGIVKAM